MNTSQPEAELDIDGSVESVFELMQQRKADAQSEDAPEDEAPEEIEQEEEAETEDEAEAEQEAEPVKAKVKVGDEELDLDEVVAGYMKDADYRQKTTQVAEQRRQVEQLQEYVSKELGNRVQNLDILTQAMHRELIGDQAQLEQLIRTDPAEYLVQKHRLDQKIGLFEQARQERQAIEYQQAQLEQQRQAEYLQAESQRMLERMPSWKDTAKADAEKREIAEALLSDYGYTADELQELYDHRALLIARDAVLWRKHVQGQKQAAKAPPTPIKSGQSKPSAKQVSAKDAFQRLSKTGSMDDAMAILRLQRTK